MVSKIDLPAVFLAATAPMADPTISIESTMSKIAHPAMPCSDTFTHLPPDLNLLPLIASPPYNYHKQNQAITHGEHIIHQINWYLMYPTQNFLIQFLDQFIPALLKVFSVLWLLSHVQIEHWILRESSVAFSLCHCCSYGPHPTQPSFQNNTCAQVVFLHFTLHIHLGSTTSLHNLLNACLCYIRALKITKAVSQVESRFPMLQVQLVNAQTSLCRYLSCAYP